MALDEYVKIANGKYFVIGIDKFSDEDFLIDLYETPEAALKVATQMTTEAMPNASDSSIATVYYAYTPKGSYLGGDTWSSQGAKDEFNGMSLSQALKKLTEDIETDYKRQQGTIKNAGKNHTDEFKMYYNEKPGTKQEKTEYAKRMIALDAAFQRGEALTGIVKKVFENKTGDHSNNQ